MNEGSNRVDHLLEAIRSEAFFDGRLSTYHSTLYMFDFSPAEQPHLSWLLSLLPMQVGDRSIGSVDLFECARAMLERKGRWARIQHFSQGKSLSETVQKARFLEVDALVDAILEEVAVKERDAVLLSGFGDASVAWSPSGLLSQLNSRLPEVTKLVALLPGVVDRDKFRFFDSEERIFPAFRYLRLVQ